MASRRCSGFADGAGFSGGAGGGAGGVVASGCVGHISRGDASAGRSAGSNGATAGRGS